MRTTTADYKAAIYATDRECRGYIKFNNDGTKIIRGVDGLISITLHEQLCDEERPMINCACSRYVEVEFFNSGLPGGVSLANSYIDTYMGIVTKDTGTAPIGSIEPDTKTVEYIWNGRFYINEINRGKQTTKVIAYDEFAKLNKEYVPTVTKGVSGYSMNDILVDVLTQCNFVVHTGGISGYVQEIPQCTCMQMVGWLIGKATLGSNAKMSRANANNIQSTTLKTQWTHRNDADHTVTDNEIYLGGLADGDAFTITSVTTGTADNPIVVGSGTGVVGESPYLDSTDAASILSDITGITFKPMTIEFRGNPAIDTGDVLKVTSGGTSNYCYVQKILTTFNGGIKQKIECFGDSEFYYSTEMNPTTTQIKNAVSSMAQEIQQEIETADNGVITKILDLDGSWKELVIANNQDLSAATSVWRWNINGLAHSTAYSGGTYNFAVDMNGRIIANAIQTGILTDALGKNSWNLDTGAFTITDGSIHINSGSDLTSKIVFDATNTPNNPGDFHLSIQPYMIYGSFTDPGGDVYFVEMDAEANWFEAGLSTSTLQLQNQLRSDMLLMQRYTKNPITITKQSELNHTHLYFYNGASNKYTTLLDPDSSGAGRIYLGDGTSNTKRTSLTNTGLEFANSSGTVTASYPATGLQKLTGAIDSTTASDCMFYIPYVTYTDMGITASADYTAFTEALFKWLAANYPHKTRCTFEGIAQMNNYRKFSVYIYDTDAKSNGIPRYGGGTIELYTGQQVSIFVNNYVASYFTAPLGFGLQDIGSRNLFQKSTIATYSANGVDIIPNNYDGTIKIVGTATTAFNVNIGSAYLNAGIKYVMTGATGGSTSKAYLNIPSVANDTGSGSGNFTVSSSGTYNVRIIIAAGTALDLTFSPMIARTGAASNYVPYAISPQNYGLWNTKGSIKDYVATSGTVRNYPLSSGGVYLITVTRMNTTSIAFDGMWLCTWHSTNKHLTAIRQPTSSYNIATTSTGVSITTWDNYMCVSILQLGVF